MIHMLESRQGRRWWISVALTVLLAGCGEDEPPEQTPAASPTLSGIATLDDRVHPGSVTAKGIAGLPRTANNSSGTNQYRVDLSQLTGPYVVRWGGLDENDEQVFLYSVATQPGTANITPLTTLLFAQLMGQEPAGAYAAFAASGASMVTEENIRLAQAKVTAYLRDVLGVTVQSDADFITSPFQTTPGDPMYDTIMALDAALGGSGAALTEASRQVAFIARLCIEERILIDVAGAEREFCPATKTAERDADDNSIIDYVFTTATNDTLTVRVRGDEVLSAEYATAGEVYSCSGAGCGGIVLGIPVSDQTRSVDFTSVALIGSSGSAVIGGVLMGAIPSVQLPVLPCDHNKFYAILEDNTVIGQCVDAFDPLNVGGTINQLRGAEPARAVYAFNNSSGIDPAYPQVELVMDGNDSVVSVYFFQYDPETFIPSMQFACEGAECNGITLGPVTVNTDLGPEYPVLIRNVTFDDTVLSGMTLTGEPTGTAATLRASFTTVYFTDPFAPVLYPPLADCDPASVTVSVEVHSGSFNFCSSEAFRLASTTGESDVKLEMYDDGTFAPIELTLRDDAVVSVIFHSSVGSSFSCSATCEGVSVSTPDELGQRTVSFANTVLYEVQSFPRPGPRTATLDGGPIAFPPP
jgi:hypothetical protein